MSCQQFSQKRPGEQVGLTFDFTLSLPGDAAITSIDGNPVVSVNSGEDANPSAVLDGSAAIADGEKAVIVPVTGGLPGCSYLITVTVNTTVGRLVLSGLLPITPALADCL